MSADTKKKRSGNISDEQRTLLAEFMREHPELVSGKFSKSFTTEDAANLWKNITEILNATNGGEKDWKGWRKCWQDYRSRSKAKQAAINVERQKTGGGKCLISLTADEETVLSLIPQSLTSGHVDVAESLAEMNIDTQVDYFQDVESTSQIVMAKSTEESYENTDEILIVGNEKENYDMHQGNETTNAYFINEKEPKRLIGQKRIAEATETAQSLTEVAQKNYLLKKKSFDEMCVYKRRKCEAMERIATAAENCQTS